MAKIAEWFRVDPARVSDSLRDAQQKLNAVEGEQVLDMSSVRQVDVKGMAALQELMSVAEEKKLKLILRGVNIDVYRVLKLTRAADRLAFIN